MTYCQKSFCFFINFTLRKEMKRMYKNGEKEVNRKRKKHDTARKRNKKKTRSHKETVTQMSRDVRGGGEGGADDANAAHVW